MKLLRDLLSVPYRKPLDFSEMPLESIVAHMKDDIHESHSTLNTALSFYMTQQLNGDLLAKFGPNHLVTDKKQLAFIKARMAENHLYVLRLFWYGLSISHREARHVKVNPEIYEDGLYGVGNWLEHLRGGGAGSALKALFDPPDVIVDGEARPVRVGEYLDFLTRLFLGKKFNNAYGGEKWANISHTVSRFVHGELSGELFADTMWTLAHNTGHIFNKGIVFDNPGSPDLLRVLDAQRGGQIPSYIKQYQPDSLLAGQVAQIEELFGLSYAPNVDWKKAKELGALGHYNTTGPLPAFKKPKPVQPPVHLENPVTFFPGLTLNKITIARAA